MNNLLNNLQFIQNNTNININSLSENIIPIETPFDINEKSIRQFLTITGENILKNILENDSLIGYINKKYFVCAGHIDFSHYINDYFPLKFVLVSGILNLSFSNYGNDSVCNFPNHCAVLDLSHNRVNDFSEIFGFFATKKLILINNNIKKLIIPKDKDFFVYEKLDLRFNPLEDINDIVNIKRLTPENILINCYDLDKMDFKGKSLEDFVNAFNSKKEKEFLNKQLIIPNKIEKRNIGI